MRTDSVRQSGLSDKPGCTQVNGAHTKDGVSTSQETEREPNITFNSETGNEWSDLWQAQKRTDSIQKTEESRWVREKGTDSRRALLRIDLLKQVRCDEQTKRFYSTAVDHIDQLR